MASSMESNWDKYTMKDNASVREACEWNSGTCAIYDTQQFWTSYDVETTPELMRNLSDWSLMFPCSDACAHSYGDSV